MRLRKHVVGRAIRRWRHQHGMLTHDRSVPRKKILDEALPLFGDIEVRRVSKGAGWTANFTPPTAEYGEPVLESIVPDAMRLLALEKAQAGLNRSAT